jgi:GR25 family glycosyltransferase involved in LPS biosynthesis/tetratricopeptide (TPR) repeat protein
MKTLCLNMIVKNEGHIILETLKNILSKLTIDYWVISDTGSTDNTPNLIIDFFQKRKIPGILTHDEWKNFGHNRTVALNHAYQKSDYLFIFDADDKIEGDMKIPTQTLNKDMYSIKMGKDHRYFRTLLVNNRKSWKFVGVLHEYIACNEETNGKGILEGNYFVDSRRLGDRSKDKDKYKKDAALLEKAFEEEKDTGLRERYAFYTAQSYRDSQQTQQAIEWYKKVLTLGNWNQEKYYSCITLGQLYHSIENFEMTLLYDTKSIEYDPERIEGIVHLCKVCYEKGMHTMVNLLYEQYKHLSLDSMNLSTKLFLVTSSYQDEISYYNSVSSYYIKNLNSGYESCKRNLLNQKVSESRLLNALDNLIYYQEALKKDSDTYALFQCIHRMIHEKDKSLTENDVVLWNLLFEQNIPHFVKPNSTFTMKNRENPTVFLSFTTCKRLDLFCKTVNSILNCWEDIDKVDYWFCVDDHSSGEDRQKMRKLYPWIEFVMKKTNRGHQSSMNLIYDKLVQLKPTYWIHMEDDFLFFDKMKYVTQGIRGLTEFPMKQILFNRSYGESIDHYRTSSHKVLNDDFAVHVYEPNKVTEEYNCYYWPHYSFRPSILDVSAVLSLGNYECKETFFERTYADRWTARGYTSGFFNKLTNIHIGRQTKDRANKNIPNAYILNEVSQFKESPTEKVTVSTAFATTGTDVTVPIKIVNLKRREDRKREMIQQLEKQGFKREEYTFVEAVDAYAMEPTIEMYELFKNNDFGNRKGFIGCALSHYRLWKELLEDDVDRYLILEDDCTFVPNFRERLKNLTGDVTFLGYSMFSDKREKTKHLYTSDASVESFPLNKDLYIGGTFAYMVDKRGAEKMCQYIQKNGIRHGIDYMMKIINELDSREIRPQLVYSPWCEPGKKVDSNIQTNGEAFDFSQFIDDGYVFIQGKDQTGEDLGYSRKSLTLLKEECRNNPKCIGFNTLGYMKHSLIRLTGSPYFSDKDGMFIKKEVYEKWSKQKKRVKLLCNWCSSKTLVHEWSNLYNQPYGWNDLVFTWEDTDIDYYVIINKPHPGSFYIPEKTIVFQMEPWVDDPSKHWGVKTWGEWACPDESKFLKVLGRKQNVYNNVFWQLEQNYQQLKELSYPSKSYPSKQNRISSICSQKYFDEGHIHRIDFLRFLEKKGDVSLDIYGNEPNFKNYRRVLSPYQDKSQGLIPYKYYFMVENNYETNFVTEKLWEPILCECLCFYFGCPNVKEIVDERAYVLLDMYDFEKSYRLIQQAIEQDWWSQRIEFIRKEKHRLLEEMAFCPRLEKVIRDQWIVPMNYERVCFIHSCTLKGNTKRLDTILQRIRSSPLYSKLDKIYVINLGDSISLKDPKVVCVQASSQTDLYESATLHKMIDFSKQYPDSQVLYLHNKGISYSDDYTAVNDWIEMMLYFLVEKHEICLEKLKEVQVVGSNYSELPEKHFSGNFWWANARYLSSMKPIAAIKSEGEMCLFRNNPSYYEMHHSGINHYRSVYPKTSYSDKV